MKTKVNLNVNYKEGSSKMECNKRLLDALKENYRYSGVNEGYGEGLW